MFTVIHPGEVQEFLHIVTDVFPLFPYHSDLYADGWTEGNSQYVNSNVILCVGMFVVGQALFETVLEDLGILCKKNGGTL